MSNQLYQHYVEQTINKLYFYCSVTIIPFGIIVFCVDFIGTRSKEFNKNNIRFSSALFYITNSLVLIWCFVIYKYLRTIGIDIESFSSISCALFVYTSRVLEQIPVLSIALSTHVYYMTVIYPSKISIIN